MANSRLARRLGRAATIGGCSGWLLEAVPPASCLIGSFSCHVLCLPADVTTTCSAHVLEVSARARKAWVDRRSPPGGQCPQIAFKSVLYAPCASARAWGERDKGVTTSWGDTTGGFELEQKEGGPFLSFAVPSFVL